MARRILGYLALIAFLVTGYINGGTNPDPAPWMVYLGLAIFAGLLITRFGLTRFLRWHEKRGLGLSVELEEEPRIERQVGSPTEEFELLKLESELLQSRFDKYDTLIFQLRGWLMTISLGAASAYVALQSHPVAILWLTASLAAGFWIIEYRWRLDWHKYVQRYKFIRDTLNSQGIVRLASPLDLTDHYRRERRALRYEKEYGSMIGSMLEEEYRGASQTMPITLTQEMSYFYPLIIGALVAMSALLRYF